MKILVCISKTPDTTSKIAFKENNSKFDEAGVQWIINPYDEWYALVKAIELKEKDASVTIHLIHVGLNDGDAILRKALALGGDEAYRVNTKPEDSYNTAFQIAEFAGKNNYDLILTGKETIDYNSSATGSIISALLDLPYNSLATNISVDKNTATVTREIEGGSETAETNFPLVISCQKGVAEQRIPNMRGIMAARTKPLKAIEPVSSEALTSIINFTLPPPKAGVKLVDAANAEELVRLLHEEAKVI